MVRILYTRGRQDAARRVLLAVPAGTGSLDDICAQSISCARLALEREGIAADLLIESNNCHVDDARNSIVAELIHGCAKDASDLIFIDSDVGFRSEDLLALINFDADVVAGVYPKKTDRDEYPVHTAGGVDLYADSQGLVEVQGAPTGFMRIKRHVLETLAKAEESAERVYFGQGNSRKKHWPIFERILADGRRWSGDYAFCYKWRARGGKVHVAPEMLLDHAGRKSWSGRLGDYWKREHGLTQQLFDGAVARLRGGEPLDDATLKELISAWGNPWAAAPELLVAAYEMTRARPIRVLEIGSGLTTILLGIAARHSGAKVWSLENDPSWFGKVAPLSDGATVILSPMTSYVAGATGEHCVWYLLSDDLPQDVDLVVIDGPARIYGRGGAWCAVPHLMAAPTWLVDDMDDPVIAELVERHAGERKVVFLDDDGRSAIVTKEGA